MESLLERWRGAGQGWSQLICDPLLEVAFGHLEPAVGPGSVVLDLGCGWGHVAGVFADSGCHAVGLDPDGEMLRTTGERHPRVARLRGTAESIPLATGSVDALFSLSVLQYTDRAAALAECRRVLRPGGRFAIVENLRGNPVALAYRAAKRVTGSDYPAHMRPAEHLAWGGREVYTSVFSRVDFTPMHLAAPALLALPAGARGPDRRRAPTPWMRMVHGVDRALLRVPALRHAAWCVVACGVR